MAPTEELGPYDIIIVGGGTAGCVLAARLTEDPTLSVLMLEAGADANNDPRVYTPGLFPGLFGDPERDWQYMSEPNPGLHGRQMDHPRGKCIGGSSAINLMAMIYPSKSGLDAWAEMGNPGWDHKSMAPYYRKFQTHVPPSKEIQEALGIDWLDSEFTGTCGPIKASFPQVLDPLHKAWIDAWKNLQRVGNPVDGVGNGGFTAPSSVNIETGGRSFAGLEFWEPVKGRANLRTIVGAHVERVVLEKDGGGGVTATGVVFHEGEKRYLAKAAKEVILCAGTFGSPQILELSGTGSKELCEAHGIESVIDNPNVGENLQDHLMIGPSFEVADGVATTDMIRDPEFIKAAMEQYEESHSGPLSWGGGYNFAYTPLVDFITPQPREDLKDLLDKHLPPSDSPKFKAEAFHHAFIRKVIESPDETSAAMLCVTAQHHPQRHRISEKFAITEPENFFTIYAQLSHPFSRGSVHIKSPDFQVKPTIETNYLSHPLDAEILARHIMQCEAIARTEPLASYLKPNGRRLPEGQNAHTLEAAIEFARSSAESNYHPSGTCAMMPLELGGVVNERLVVHGTRNLRVVDASIFPIEPRGNICTSVYAAAEKGADMVKEDLRKRDG